MEQSVEELRWSQFEEGGAEKVSDRGAEQRRCLTGGRRLGDTHLMMFTSSPVECFCAVVFR